MIVVLPYYPGDQDIAVNLSKWIKELGSNKGRHLALILRDSRCHHYNQAAIKHNLESVFESVETLEVAEMIDGWPQAPNLMFRKAAKHIQFTYNQPFLWLEPDVVPLKSGWVEALAKEYAECGKPFLGDFVKVENVIPHCSGIAVYPGKVIDHAGDAVMAVDTAWDVWAADQIVPKMAQTHLIAHRWKFPKLNNQSEVDNLLGQIGDAVLFHQDKTGSLIELLRERRYAKATTSRPISKQNVTTGRTESGIGTVDIFIKTYPKDKDWLELCLKSIHKFASGFRKEVVIGMNNEEENGNDGYLSQQVFKMYADTYTDADYILHIDSDTIFTRPVTPGTYFRHGKPIIMMTPIEQAHPDEQNAWRRVMHKFMGKPTEFEFMRRFPIIYPRWAYGALREFCEKTHEMPLDKYIMSQPYREFSEFNCMGFYLWEYHRDRFHWIDTSKTPESEWPKLTVDQQWSHNPIPVEKWEKILANEHGSAKPDSLYEAVRESPKLVRQTTLEKRRAALVKARAAKAAKRKRGDDIAIPESMRGSKVGASKVQSSDAPNGSLGREIIPWNNRIESIACINWHCVALKKFCCAPMHVKRVRDELKSVGVIR